MAQPIRAPIAEASRIAAEQNVRTSGSASIRSPVAPVSADTGFIVRLPHSLYQMSRRMPADERHVEAAPASAHRPGCCTRSDSPPSGSPMISLRPCRCSTRPGSAVEALGCTTHPITCSNGIARAMVPPGSTLSSGAPSSASTPRREPPRHAVHRRQHHRLRPEQRLDLRRHVASDRPLTAMTTRSCRPRSRGGIAGARRCACAAASSWRRRQP